MKFRSKLSWLLLCVLVFGLSFTSGQEVSAANATKSIKINNTTLEFNDIVYVDGTNGSDLTGDGNAEKPYKTILQAQKVAEDGNAIYIKAGTYNESKGWNSYFEAGLCENTRKLTFIGESNRTIIVADGTKHSKRDSHAVVFETDCSVYNITFKYTAGNRTKGYSRALVGSGSLTNPQYGKFNNCVFIATDKAPSPCYGSKDINVEFNHCSFIIPDNFLKNHVGYGKDKTIWLNCAVSKNTYTTGTTCVGNATFSADDYRILSSGWRNCGTGTDIDGTRADIGVYGGAFAWGYTEAIVAAPELKGVLDTDQKKVDLSWNKVTDATSYNIKRSATTGGPYTTVATGSAITYTDGNVTVGTTYYYVVSAVNSNMESKNSNEVIAVLPNDKKLKVVLEVDEQLQLSVSDELSDNTKVTWTSSNSTVASVDAGGMVTALDTGNAVITVTNKRGTYKETIHILVVDDASDYRLAVDLKTGKTCRLTVDDNKNNVKVTWTSMDPTVATVSNKGKVTAVSEGLTIMTATDADGNVIGQVYIRVRS